MFKVGQRVEVTVPAMGEYPEEHFFGTVIGVDVPCQVSGIIGLEVQGDAGDAEGVHHLDPAWVK